jgi:hypothetical protein
MAIEVEGIGRVEYSAVDLANCIVFANPEAFGLSSTESPNTDLMEKFEKFGLSVGVALGFASNIKEASGS